MKTKLLIYGALGYMGRLFTEFAQAAGLPIVLAAREPELAAHARALGVEARIFSLDAALEAQLHDITLVVNLAGPFALTQGPWIAACLATGTHYLDIAGEYQEFQSAHAHDAAARAAGVMLLPGAGFGVVPTDIAALLARRALPDATRLAIGFATEGGVSQGTLRTVLKDIHKAGVQRVGGQLVPAMPATGTWQASTAAGKAYTLQLNPWRADLFTAHLSTGIQEISTYSAFPGLVVRFMQGRMLWLRNLLLNRLLRFLPVGPSPKQRSAGRTHVWAEASNASGRKVLQRIDGPEAYDFTAATLQAISHRVLAGDARPGFQTPGAYGEDLLAGIAGVRVHAPA